MAPSSDTGSTTRRLRPINLCEIVICLRRGWPRHCPKLNVTFGTDLFQAASGSGRDAGRHKKATDRATWQHPMDGKKIAAYDPKKLIIQFISSIPLF